jgi:hypothetical protein
MAARATATIHLLVPPDLKRWLEARAQEEDRTLSWYCVRIINEYRARVTQGSGGVLTGPQPLDPRPDIRHTLDRVVSDSHQGPSAVEFEVERFQRHFGQRLLVDKTLRDPWVCLLVEGLQCSVPRVAKMLHMTERSVYRMVKGEQTKRDRRKKSGPQADSRRRDT